jgi:hypothetical protein
MITTGTAPFLFLGPDARIVRAVEDIDTKTSRKWAGALRQVSYDTGLCPQYTTSVIVYNPCCVCRSSKTPGGFR